MSVTVPTAKNNEQTENKTIQNEKAKSNSVSIQFTNEVYEKTHENVPTCCKHNDKKTTGLFGMQYWIFTAPHPTKANVSATGDNEIVKVKSSTEIINAWQQYVYKPTKNGFLKKVFKIVVLMLFITIALNLIVTIPIVKKHFKSFGLLYLTIAIIILLALTYGLLCSVCCRMIQCRKKIIIFAIIGMSLFTSFFTANCSAPGMIGILVAVFLHMLLNLWLADENVDFTCLMYYIIMILGTLLSLTLVSIIVFKVFKEEMEIVYMVLFFVGILLHGFMVPIQLQMITNGKLIEVGVEEVTYAAYMFYMSVFDMIAKVLLVFNLLDEW